MRKSRFEPKNAELYKKRSTIVIDEASMLKADLTVRTLPRELRPRRPVGVWEGEVRNGRRCPPATGGWWKLLPASR